MTLMLAMALGLCAAAGGGRVIASSTSRDGMFGVDWIASAPDGACTRMRFTARGVELDVTRFQDGCSAIRAPFSPDGRHAIFQLSDSGPIHVVSTRNLTLYLNGEALADAVVYPADPAGLPPEPERVVEFLGWRGPEVFELTGASGGGVSRYSYIVGEQRIVETCFKDGLRPRCTFPSPDGRYVMLSTSKGAHVVERTQLDAFHSGTSSGLVFIGNERFRTVGKPVFQEWKSPTEIVLQGEGESRRTERFVLDVRSGKLSAGEPVRWTWE